MFNNKILFLLGALILVNLAIAAAHNSSLEDGIAKILTKRIDQYDQQSQCWVKKYPHVLLKEKIYCLHGILEMFKQAMKVNNELAEENCRTDVQLQPCPTGDYDSASECLLRSIRSLIRAYGEQEECSGKPFNTKSMEITKRFMRANLAGWNAIHPGC